MISRDHTSMCRWNDPGRQTLTQGTTSITLNHHRILTLTVVSSNLTQPSVTPAPTVAAAATAVVVTTTRCSAGGRSRCASSRGTVLGKFLEGAKDPREKAQTLRRKHESLRLDCRQFEGRDMKGMCKRYDHFLICSILFLVSVPTSCR
jgi:hypothetical protein